MIIVDYTADQMMPFAHLFYKYWEEVEHRKPIDLIRSDDGLGIGNELQQKLYSYMEEGAKVKLAYHERELIGFLIYHCIFGCVMIVRAVYLEPKYRLKNHLRKLIFSVGRMKRIFSQTYANLEPKEIQGVKRNRKLIATIDGMNIWENRLGGV